MCSKCQKTENFNILKRCNHGICDECLVKNLEDLSISKIKCFKDGCNKYIPDNLIRKCLTDDQIEMYERLSVAECSQKSELALKTIKCLTEKCIYLTLCDKESYPSFECEFCSSPNCVKCKKRHYPNECGRNDMDETVIEERARQKLKERNRLKIEQLLMKNKLSPNPSSFKCTICLDFFPPRLGVVLRNCMHTFCKDCLFQAIENTKFISQMTCLYEKCKIPIDSSELSELVNEKQLSKMMINEAASRLFQCKSESCNGNWDATDKTGTYQCPVCKVVNCLDCKDIHTGIPCSEYRKSKRYKTIQSGHKVLTENRKVKCFLCLNVLIQDGGCGSMYCDRCGNHTCIFTGKITGKHEPQKCYCNGSKDCTKLGNFCNCTPTKPCHKDCTYGCFDE